MTLINADETADTTAEVGAAAPFTITNRRHRTIKSAGADTMPLSNTMRTTWEDTLVAGVVGCRIWTGLRHLKGESAGVMANGFIGTTDCNQFGCGERRVIAIFLSKPQHDFPVRRSPRTSPSRLPPATASGTKFERFISANC